MPSKTVLAAILALGACRGTPTAPRTPQLAEGFYALALVNDSTPPVLIEGGAYDSTWVLDGQVIVAGDSAEMSLRKHFWSYAGEDTTRDLPGRYAIAVEADSVWLYVSCPGAAVCVPGWVGHVDGDTLDLTLNELPRDLPVYTFRRILVPLTEGPH